jgi:hypothetical protein
MAAEMDIPGSIGESGASGAAERHYLELAYSGNTDAEAFETNVAQWLSDIQGSDPNNLSLLAAVMINNPWRDSHASLVPSETALYHYRRAVGIDHIEEAVALRQMLTGVEQFDGERISNFGYAISAERAMVTTPIPLDKETEALTNEWRDRFGGQKNLQMATRHEVPLSELAASLRLSATDTLRLGTRFSMQIRPVRQRKGGSRPELHTSIAHANGLRVGLRAAQIAAGLADLVDTSTIDTLNMRSERKQSLALRYLRERKLGWQSTGLWQSLSACDPAFHPGAFAIFGATYRETLDENEQPSNVRSRDDPAIVAAQQICRTCIVRPQCAEWKLVRGTDISMRDGVGGGMTSYQQGYALTLAEDVTRRLTGIELDQIYAPYLDAVKAAAKLNIHRPSGESEEEEELE